MLFLLSPAKNLDFESQISPIGATKLQFSKKTEELVTILQDMSTSDIKKLMNLSDNLANLNYGRYENFYTQKQRPALMAFKGDVYKNINIDQFDDKNWQFAQENCRILSGLYGILKPKDAIYPYRLEMGTKLNSQFGKNLYQFWGDLITENINKELEGQKNKVVVNLASKEYFGAVNENKINGKVINIDFKQRKGNQLKTIGLMAKRARGAMADFIIRNFIEDCDCLVDFKGNDYLFDQSLSDDNKMVFVAN
jgi:cytoplasmic iron level regulating protein YaaA (DUF328/UPF0246 family)